MPAVLTAPTAYDTVTTVMNMAKQRLNDEVKTLLAVGGGILRSSQPFTQQAVNSAWRKEQEWLANLGYQRLNREAVITGLPVAGGNDPTTKAYINWFNYSDGVNLFPKPVLPQDFVFPLWVKERISGQNCHFVPMEPMLDGFQVITRQAFNRVWQWREDAIWFPGALQVLDIQIKYAIYLADFDDVGLVQWFQQPVPIMRCADSFSLYLCAEFIAARGQLDLAMKYEGRAQDAAKLVVNRDIRMKERVNVRRQSRSGRLEGGYGRGAGNNWG